MFNDYMNYEIDNEFDFDEDMPPEMPMMQEQYGSQCVPMERCITNVRLATAYVPFQYLCQIFDPHNSLHNGTVFPELVSPYQPIDKKCRCMCEEECI